MKLNPINPAENPMDAILFCFGGDGGDSGGGDSRSEADRSYEDDFGFSSDIAGGYSGSASDIGGTDFGGGDDNDNYYSSDTYSGDFGTGLGVGDDSRSEAERAYEDVFGFSPDMGSIFGKDAPKAVGQAAANARQAQAAQQAAAAARQAAMDAAAQSYQVSTPAPATPAIVGEVIRGTAPSVSVPAPVDTGAIAAESFGVGRPDMPLQPTVTAPSITAPTIAPPSVSFPEQAQVIESLLGAPQVSEFVGPAGMGLILDGVFTPAEVPVTEAGMQGDISPYTVESAVDMAPSAYASQGVPRLGEITKDRAVQLDLAAPQGTSSADMDQSFFDRLNAALGLTPEQSQRVAFQITVNPETGQREYGPVMQEAPSQFGETLGRAFSQAILGALGPLGLGFNIGDVRGYIDPVTGERYQYSEVGGFLPGLFGGGQPQLRSYAEMQAERDAEMAARDSGGDGGGTPPAVPAVEAPPPAPIYAPQLQRPTYRTPQLPFGGTAPTSQAPLMPQPMATNWYQIPERFRGAGLLG